jgi:taurine--2-oxoglutarate transaminase
MSIKKRRSIDNVNKVGAFMKKELLRLKDKHKSSETSGVSVSSAWSNSSQDTKTKEALVPYGRDPEKIMPKIVGC